MSRERVVRIVGMGPGGLDSISLGAFDALRNAHRVFIRTEHHPAVAELSGRGISFESFDAMYESAGDFEELYAAIAERVLSESDKGEVAYAVPGHPLVGERSVELIIQQAADFGVRVVIEPSSSFIEAVLQELGVGMDKGLKVLDALQIEILAPSLDTPNLIYQVYDQAAASRVKLRLMEFLADEQEVFIVTGAGTAEAKVIQTPLYELDRHKVDHLTSVYVP